MHFNHLSNIMQHHRFHGLFAIIQKALLHFNDFVCNFQQCFVTALEAFDEPFGFLKLILQRCCLLPSARFIMEV